MRQDVARKCRLAAVVAAQRAPHRHAPRFEPPQRCSLGGSATVAATGTVSVAVLTVTVTIVVAVLEAVELCRRIVKLHASYQDSCGLLRLG